MISRRNALKLSASSLLLPFLGEEASAKVDNKEWKWETKNIYYRREKDGIVYIRIECNEFDYFSYSEDPEYYHKAVKFSTTRLEDRDHKAEVINNKIEMVYCGKLGLESAKLSMIKDNEIAMVHDNSKIKTVYTYYHFGPERGQVITSSSPFHKVKY